VNHQQNTSKSDEQPESADLPDADAEVADSLQSALRELRSNAEQVENLPLDDSKVDAAAKLADAAAELDDQIGAIARSDD
jgi:hypothetical protein